MNVTELLKTEGGVIFYEDDLPAPALMQKLTNTSAGDDIIIRQLDIDMDTSRLGLREMSDADRNSKVYIVLNYDELERLRVVLRTATPYQGEK